MRLPKPSGDFLWTQEVWGPALRCTALPVDTPHFFTTRSLRLRGAPDETRAAWEELAATLGIASRRLQRLRQVHGARVIEVSSAAHHSALHEDWPEADIAISNDPTVGLVVRVADCIPLLLADRRTGAVAAVHTGWRGMAAGAPLAAVAALRCTYGAHPADLVAAVGPSVGPCCYIVGPEIVDQFASHPDAASWFIRHDALRLDLWRATSDQLRQAGLGESSIHLSRLCTACHTDVFCSYRKEKEATGRMVGVIRTTPRYAAAYRSE